MARHAEILERRLRDGDTFLYFRIFVDGPADPTTGDPTTVELGNIELPDGDPSDVRSALTTEAKRLMQLPVGKVIDF